MISWISSRADKRLSTQLRSCSNHFTCSDSRKISVQIENDALTEIVYNQTFIQPKTFRKIYNFKKFLLYTYWFPDFQFYPVIVSPPNLPIDLRPNPHRLRQRPPPTPPPPLLLDQQPRRNSGCQCRILLSPYSYNGDFFSSVFHLFRHMGLKMSNGMQRM